MSLSKQKGHFKVIKQPFLLLKPACSYITIQKTYRIVLSVFSVY